jgi:hypothetical protein
MALGARDGQTQTALIDTLALQIPEEVAAALEGNNPRRALVKMALSDLEGTRQVRRDGNSDAGTVWLVPPPPDPRFQLHPILSKELPRASAEADWNLEWQLVTEGCRDVLLTWTFEGQTFLVDGHRRESMCRRHGLPYVLQDLGPLSSCEVLRWMWQEHGARRNLTSLAQHYSRGHLYNENKPGRGRPTRRGARDHGSPLLAAAAIAGWYGISERTLRRDARFAEALDNITAVCGAAFRSGVLSGTVPAGPATVRQLARLDEGPMRQQVRDWLEGTLPAPRPASQKARLMLLGESDHEWVASLVQQQGWDGAKKFHTLLGLQLNRNKPAARA